MCYYSIVGGKMNREKYYQAILNLQKHKSITNISMRDIAKELNITTGSLYYHFSGKNDLLNKMFCFYKHSLEEFIIEHQQDDLTSFLNEYINYNKKYIDQFRFTSQSEIANFLTEESISYSHDIHLKLIEKLQINPEDKHIKIIVLGSIRSMLTAPSFYDYPNQDKLVFELIKIIKSSSN